MFCSYPFVDVDFLLVPMFIPIAVNWMLGFVHFKHLTHTIINSFKSQRLKDELEDLTYGLATILPHLLASEGFF